MISQDQAFLKVNKSLFFELIILDPKGYWGRKIFQEAHKYITQNRTTVPQFFKQYGMESDFSISQYEFTEAMGVLIRSNYFFFQIFSF